MKTLLVPIDFSAATETVLDAATATARALGARVVLVHVIEPLVALDESSEMIEDEVVATERAVEGKLDELRCRCTALGLPASARLLYGTAPHQVTEEALRLRPDLIVIGSHGHGAIYSLLAGGVTAQVLRHAPCPVLVIPVGAHAAAAAPAAAAQPAWTG